VRDCGLTFSTQPDLCPFPTTTRRGSGANELIACAVKANRHDIEMDDGVRGTRRRGDKTLALGSDRENALRDVNVTTTTTPELPLTREHRYVSPVVLSTVCCALKLA
jgi:hypothetical protein